VDGGRIYGDDGNLSDLNAFQPDAKKRQRGATVGMGARPAGTGARTRENFTCGFLLFLAKSLCLRSLSIIFDDPLLDHVSPEDREAVSAMVSAAATWS